MKSSLKKCDIESILDQYCIGKLRKFEFFKEGTVQCNVKIETDENNTYVLRWYIKRSFEEVIFEIDVLLRLHRKKFISPFPVRKENSTYNEEVEETTPQDYIGLFEANPFVVFNYIEGRTLGQGEFDDEVRSRIGYEIGKLHVITKDMNDIRNMDRRMNYDVDFLKSKVEENLFRYSKNVNVLKKLDWINETIEKYVRAEEMERFVPKGICHCDYAPTNMLFSLEGKDLEGIIDFDDCNYTYLVFDLVNFIDWMCWKDDKEMELDLDSMKKVFRSYQNGRGRELTESEKKYFLDVYVLQVLIDTIWFLEREAFKEKRKEWGDGVLSTHLEEMSNVTEAVDFLLTGLRCILNGDEYSWIFPDGSPFFYDDDFGICDESMCYEFYVQEGILSSIDCDIPRNRSFVCEFEIPICGGILSTDEENVCSGAGVCIAGRCECFDGFSGWFCDNIDPIPSFVLDADIPCEESEFVIISAREVLGHSVRFRWSHLSELYVFPSAKIKYSDLVNAGSSFNVTAYDIWGRSSPTIHLDAQSLVILGATINGYRYHEVTTTLRDSKFLLFKGRYESRKYCVSISTVAWSVEPPIPTFALDQFALGFGEAGLGDTWPPNSQNYMISMTLYNETNDLNETAILNLTVIHDELVLNVRESSGNVPYDRPIIITVDEFFDHDHENLTNTLVWECESDDIEEECSIVEVSPNVHKIDPHKPFVTYSVSITYIVGERSKMVSRSFTTTNVTSSQISNIFYPDVFIVSHKCGDTFFPGQEILLMGSVRYTHFENITDLRALRTFWTSDSLDLSSAVLSPSLNSRYLLLKIPEDYDSSTITFNFVVQPDGSNLNRSCHVVLDLDPLCSATGSVDVYPTTGSIFATSFEIFFQNWDDDISLDGGETIKYALSYTDPCSEDEEISVFHGSTECLNTFRLSSHGIYNLTAMVYVEDTGFRITRTFEVEVDPEISRGMVERVLLGLLGFFHNGDRFSTSDVLSTINSVYQLINVGECDGNNYCLDDQLCAVRNVRANDSSLFYLFQKYTVIFLNSGIENDLFIKDETVMIVEILSKLYIPSDLGNLICSDCYLDLIWNILKDDSKLAPALSQDGRATLSLLIGKFEVGHPRPDPVLISKMLMKLVECSLVDDDCRYPDSAQAEGLNFDTGSSQTDSDGVVSTPIEMRTKQRYIIEEEGTNDNFSIDGGEYVFVSFSLSYLFDDSSPNNTLPGFDDVFSTNTLSYAKYIISDEKNSTNQSCGVFNYVNGEPSSPPQIRISFHVDPDIFSIERYINQQQEEEEIRRRTTNEIIYYSVTCFHESGEKCSETIVFNSSTSLVTCICEEPNAFYELRLLEERTSSGLSGDLEDDEADDDTEIAVYIVSAFSTVFLIFLIANTCSLLMVIVCGMCCCCCLAVSCFACGGCIVLFCSDMRKKKKVHPDDDKEEEEGEGVEEGDIEIELPSYVYEKEVEKEEEEEEKEKEEESDGEIYDEEEEEEDEEEEEEEGEEKEDLECIDDETFVSMRYKDIEKFVIADNDDDDDDDDTTTTYTSEEEDVEENSPTPMTPEEFEKRQNMNLKMIFEGAVIDNKIEKFKEFKVKSIENVKTAYEKASEKRKKMKVEFKKIKKKAPSVEYRDRWKN